MVEKLGKNKVHENGTVSLPKEVLEKLDIEKGEDILGFKNCEKEEHIEITTTQVDF